MRRVPVLALVVVAAALTLPALPAAASAVLVRPVDGPVVRGFTARGTYGPGRRAILFLTDPPVPVRAAAGGTVTFAGTVAGVRYVTVEHPDDVLTTYGHLLSVSVRAGQSLTTGAVLGTAAAASALTGGRPALTFSLRVSGTYVDPLPWFSQRRVHLVA